MNAQKPTDEVVGAITRIDMHRREMQGEAAPAAAANEALRKLHQLLEREKHSLQLHGPGAHHAANINAVAAEIENVKKLAAAANPRAGQGRLPGQPAKGRVRASAAHNPPQKKGRRTMGRRGDR